MPRPSIQEVSAAYSKTYGGAKPDDRASANEEYRAQAESLKTRLVSELATLERRLIESAADIPQKGQIRKAIAAAKTELDDVTDFIALIDTRNSADLKSRTKGEADKLIARLGQIRELAETEEDRYTEGARALSKPLDALAKLRAEARSIERELEKLEAAGCEEARAGAGLAMVGQVRGAGVIEELVQLPSLKRGPAHWGKIVTEDDRPPRPMVPNPIDDYWGTTTVENPGGTKRITSPVQGSAAEQQRLSDIARQRAERERAIAAAGEWDRVHGAK
jgi:hypothetical protein